MCCAGCAAAASAISTGGWSAYYRFRDSMATRPEAATETERARWSESDNPEVLTQISTTTTDGFRRIKLLAEGLRCAACAWLIEQDLATEPGVSQVQVHYDARTLTLEWNPQRLPLSRLFERLAALGYRAYPYSARQEEQLNDKERRQLLIGLGIAGLGMMQVMMYALGIYLGAGETGNDAYLQLLRWAALVVTTPVVAIAARPFFVGAAAGLRNRHLTMDVPVSLAIGLAYLASCWSTFVHGPEVYFDSVVMFTFFLLLGRWLEAQVRARALRATLGAGQRMPRMVTQVEGGLPRSVPLSAVVPGDRLQIAAGEMIACDAHVLSGTSTVDESLLNGEAEPVAKAPGSAVVSGSVNLDQPLDVEVVRASDASRHAVLSALSARAQAGKPRAARWSDQVATWFVGGVLLLAGAVYGLWLHWAPEDAFWITLSVLVVTCPCALSLATPTALTAAHQVLQRAGLLAISDRLIETLPAIGLVVFDKTGTLTSTTPQLHSIRRLGLRSESELLALAAAIESGSQHPVASGVRAGAAQRRLALPEVRDLTQLAGGGMRGRTESGNDVLVAPPTVLGEQGVTAAVPDEGGMKWIGVAVNGECCGWLGLVESLRPSAESAVQGLLDQGLEVALLSGDEPATVAAIAERLGVPTWHARQSPESKLDWIRAQQLRGTRVLMVGDGTNDAPVLAAADLGIAVDQGSDMARINADAVVLQGALEALPHSRAIARRTRALVRQNLTWALGYNVVALPLAAAGGVPPWAAAVGMSASSLVVVLNALRVYRGPHSDHSRQRTRTAVSVPSVARPTVSL